MKIITPKKEAFTPIDNEEKLLIEAIENNELVEISNMKDSIKRHRQIAKNTIKNKKKSVSIKLATKDISQIKTIALQE